MIDSFSVGKCRFRGPRPSSSTVFGLVEVYHNGTVNQRGWNGIKKVWKGTGDIAVIYRSREEVGKHEFQVTGKIQEGFDF